MAAAAMTRQKFESMKNSLRKIRSDGKIYAKKTVGVALTAGGGASSGFVRSTTFATVPNTEIPMDIALGAVMSAVGIAMNDDVGEGVGAFGQGMLAGGLSHEVLEMMVERKRKKAAGG